MYSYMFLSGFRIVDILNCYSIRFERDIFLLPINKSIELLKIIQEDTGWFRSWQDPCYWKRVDVKVFDEEEFFRLVTLSHRS